MVLQKDKINKPLATEMKKKTQITKLRNESGNITTNSTEMKKIKREYYEQMYTKKSDNLVEMDKFLEPQNLL